MVRVESPESLPSPEPTTPPPSPPPFFRLQGNRRGVFLATKPGSPLFPSPLREMAG